MPEHFGHVVAVVVAPAVIIAGLLWYDRIVDRRDAAGLPPLDIPRGRVAVALASLGAGVVHVAVCPDHFREAAVFGLFFAVCALAQVGWAAAVLAQPSRRVWLAGLAGNAAVLALWAVTRTVGLPFGPEAGAAEAVGRADALAGVLEVVVVVAAVRALAEAGRSTPTGLGASATRG